MNFRSFLTCSFICWSAGMLAQDPALSNPDLSNGNLAGYEHHKNEIGIGSSAVYFIKGQEPAFAMHFHYVRHIPGTAFEAGLGFERIFSKTAHNVMLLELAYRPVEALTLGMSPGLLVEEGHPGVRFAFHVETAYEFEIRGFHAGPLVELAFDREDVHLSLGLHAGMGF